jgi:hypothetical protein
MLELALTVASMVRVGRLTGGARCASTKAGQDTTVEKRGSKT